MKIKSICADFFSGLLIFVISLVVIDTTDDLLYFSLCATLMLFLVSFLRAKRTQLKPWTSYLLINSLFISLIIFQSIEVNILLFIAALPSLFLSALASHLARNDNKIQALKKRLLMTIPLVTTVVYLVLSAPLLTETLLTKELVKPSPKFEFVMLKGEQIDSQKTKGKVTLINFWATWCSSCLLELPELNEVYKQYADNSDVQFLIVNSELAGDTTELVAEFVNRSGYLLPFAIDAKSKSYNDFEITGTPGLVIIDKLGNIRIKHIGFLKSENFKANLVKYLDSLLAE